MAVTHSRSRSTPVFRAYRSSIATSSAILAGSVFSVWKAELGRVAAMPTTLVTAYAGQSRVALRAVK